MRDTELDVDMTIAPGDGMFTGDLELYQRGGRSALRCVDLALAIADRPRPVRILDLPCGYGRVLRYLRAAYPDVEIVGCDVEKGGVDFCAERFGAIPVYSDVDPAQVELPGPFDLVWVGSLLTHLPANRIGPWFDLWEKVVPAGGLLVFSVAGRFVIEAVRGGRTYELDPAVIPDLLAQVDRDGFGYADYPDQEGYGISLTRAEWVVRELMARGVWGLLSYSERALNHHQDVVVCQKL